MLIPSDIRPEIIVPISKTSEGQPSSGTARVEPESTHAWGSPANTVHARKMFPMEMQKKAISYMLQFKNCQAKTTVFFV